MPLIEVSISKQQLTLYEKGEVVAHAPVSTGMAGHSTPMGIFSVIGKEIFHRSNIYSGAPMPYMQRITWSGVALHAGVLPGYPASHGCIRMPREFAVRLYGLTQRGARVLVVPREVAPVPFESAKLFTRPKPGTDKTSEAILPPPGAPDVKVLRVVRTAESQQPSVMSDAADTAAHAVADVAKPKPAEAAAAPPKPAQPMQASEPPAAPVATQATMEAGESAKVAAAVPTEKAAIEPVADAPARAAPAAAEAAEAPKHAAASGAPAEASTGTVVVKPVPVTAAQPIEVQKAFEPVGGPRQGTETFQPAPTPAAQAAQPAAAPEVKPAPTATASDEFYGPERPLRPGPITVFVSKKEGKLFVRKGFQPVFSWPVKFEHPELPLGTYLYTAIDANADGLSYRWQVVSVPTDTARKAEVRVTRDKKGRLEKVVQPAVTLPVATATEALERVDIPPVALTRISTLMSTGASLIISDKGLGSETGTETDFIVLTR
jgi:L,D-transpeptidase catalytic domain